MKTNPSARQIGVALVIVLVFVVLLSVFILSFFTNSQNELAASQSFSGEISAYQLAETASSIVQGQIREATTQDKIAWASQPGMIRAYGNAPGSPSDRAFAFYKLYSSDDMVIGPREMDAFRAKFNDQNLLGGEVPIDQNPQGTNGWDNQPALFTDLNAPITLAEPAADGSTVVKFPIIDGHDIRFVNLPAIPARPSTEPQRRVLTYDAVNERGERVPDGLPDVEGFAIDPRTVKYTEPTDEVPLSPTNTPVPMPVRWLYVLRDGTLTAPLRSEADPSTRQMTRAMWDNTNNRRPTRNNPIVGRVAFWTDDDSCKVNINTAGGFNYKDVDRAAYARERDFAGSYWDQPRTYTRFDYGDANDDGRNGEDGSVNVGGLSITQPISREYQRYPGHPATTSLGLLFKDLLNSEQLYSILPRLANRGTRGGTERLYADNSDIDADDSINEDEYTLPLPTKRDRLFASVDEFLFSRRQQDQEAFRPLNDTRLRSNPSLIDRRLGGRVYNDQLKPSQQAVTPEILERMRFFLTAHSRAPELNLFGRPRITIWPTYPDDPPQMLNDPNSRLNASDRLLNFCSIIGPRYRDDGSLVPQNAVKLFQFQRNDPYSATNDFNGVNPTPRRKVMPSTPDGGTRNQFIYSYLQELTSQVVPGFAGRSFLEKYQALDRDQILTSIFDYMRCVNMRDSTRDKYISPQNPKDPPAALWPQVEKHKFAPLGIVTPIQIQSAGQITRGFGRFPIFSEAALVFYHTGYRNKTYFSNRTFRSLRALNNELNNDPRSRGKAPQNSGNTNDNVWDRREGVTHNMVGAFLIFEAFNPMMGYAPTRTLNSKSQDRTRFVVEIQGLEQIAVTGAGASVNNLETIVEPGRGLQFPQARPNRWPRNIFMHSSGAAYHGRNLGGSEGWLHMLMGSWNPGARLDIPNKWGTNTPVEGAAAPANHWYEFQSRLSVEVRAPVNPDPVPEDGGIYFQRLNPANSATWQALQFSGANLVVRLRFGEPEQISNNLIWELKLNFPATTIPMPTDHIWMDDPGGFDLDPSYNKANQVASPTLWSSADPRMNVEAVKSFGGRLLAPPPGVEHNTDAILNNSSISKAWRHGGVFGDGSSNASGNRPPGWNNTNRWRQLLQPGDTIRSIVLGVDGADPRIVAINPENSDRLYAPHPSYSNLNVRHAQTLRTAEGSSWHSVTGLDRTKYFAGSDLPFGRLATLPGSVNYPNNRFPDIPPGIDGVRMSFGAPTRTGRPGDFDTGLGNLPDGAYTGKSDEGNPVFRVKEWYTDANGGRQWFWRYPHPYFDWAYEETFDTFFTPNRQTPSGVVFGSLPIGKNGHWTTLAFSPFSAFEANDQSGRALHPGRREGFVRDHLLLDLFNMPIVEPYAISEPFSTAGKVNMNYPIMPFGNIERSTAFRAALHSVRVSAFPNAHANIYKTTGAYNANYNYRYPVNRDMTIRAFRDYFDRFRNDVNAGLFKSASEICDRGLYPSLDPARDPVTPPRYTSPRFNPDPDFDLKSTFWRANALTGDNMREKPYSDLYPRLTTKSNTYTVHIRAQSLRQTPQSADQGIWDEKRDRVIGEYRGSSTIERFIDPEDARFDKSSASVDPRDRIDVDRQSLEPAYRFRVINTKRFVP